MRRVIRTLAYLWASPNTMLAMPLAAAALVTRGGQVRRHSGVIEVCGPPVDWLLRRLVPLPGGARAMTIGHIVIARDAAAHESTRRHERIHVRQYEQWGPLFIPAYFTASAIAALRRRDPYRDNWFERQAYEAPEQH